MRCAEDSRKEWEEQAEALRASLKGEENQLLQKQKACKAAAESIRRTE